MNDAAQPEPGRRVPGPLLALAVATLILSGPLAKGSPGAEPRPNVLVLIADDWRWDTLGCAGNPIVKTPNLDALARQGVRFSQMRVTTSVCWVSRASLLTGQWLSRHGDATSQGLQTPWSETYPALLRRAGYWTGHIGKWHNGPFPRQELDAGESYSGRHLMDQPDGSKIHVTEKNQRDTLRFLKDRPKDRPFCLTLGFFATHAEDKNPKQYIYQPSSEPLYKDVTIPVPKTADDAHFNALPPFLATERNEGRVRWHWRFDTPERFQEYMKAYYRLATEVDAVVGRIVEELKAEGAFDNTLIVFTGDNGYFHADHGLADKWYPYEQALRVPLIVVDPRLPASRRGTTNEDFVLNVDIAPTLLAAAGVSPPPRMQGKDFAPLYLSADPPKWRAEFYYEHPVVIGKDRIPASEAVVRKDVKYIYWPDFHFEELFDLKADPLEEHNLASDPSSASRLAELRKHLAELRQQAR